jgi:hypothetical protein
MRDLVMQFWIKKMMISPNWKDVVRCWITIKVHEEHAMHYLQVSQVCSYFILDFLLLLYAYLRNIELHKPK